MGPRYSALEGWTLPAFQLALDPTPERWGHPTAVGRRSASNWTVRTLEADLDADRERGAPRSGLRGEPQTGEGWCQVALEGHQDHDQAQGEAEGTVEEGQEPGVVVDGGRCEDVRWGQTSGGLVVGLEGVAMRRLCPRRPPPPWRVA